MKRLAAIVIVVVAGALGVAPSVATAGGVSAEVSAARWSPEPTRPEVWRPMPTRTAWHPAWKPALATSPVTIVAPVHRLQWKTARSLALGSRLVLQSAR